MAAKLKFDCVSNPYQWYASHLFSLDSLQDLIVLVWKPSIMTKSVNSRLITFRDRTIEYLPKSNSWNGQTDGKKIYLFSGDERTGIIISHEDRSFKTEEVSLPDVPNIISFFRAHDITYNVTRSNFEYHVLSADDIETPKPLLSYPSHTRSFYCFIHDLKGINVPCDLSFNDSVKAFTSLENRWLIVVGLKRIGIVDVRTMRVDTYSHDMKERNIEHCAASRNFTFELFVSAHNYPEEASRIYKACLPINDMSPEEEKKAFMKLEEMLREAENEGKTKVLEKSRGAIQGTMTRLQEQMTSLKTKFTNRVPKQSSPLQEKSATPQADGDQRMNKAPLNIDCLADPKQPTEKQRSPLQDDIATLQAEMSEIKAAVEGDKRFHMTCFPISNPVDKKQRTEKQIPSHQDEIVPSEVKPAAQVVEDKQALELDNIAALEGSLVGIQEQMAALEAEFAGMLQMIDNDTSQSS